MSSYLIGEIAYNPRITVLPCSEVVDGGGEGRLEWIRVRDTTTGEESTRECRGLFLLLGAEPHCDWLPPSLARDERGFVLTGRDIPPVAGSTACRRRTSRPPCRACSPPATSGPAR